MLLRSAALESTIKLPRNKLKITQSFIFNSHFDWTIRNGNYFGSEFLFPIHASLFDFIAEIRIDITRFPLRFGADHFSNKAQANSITHYMRHLLRTRQLHVVTCLASLVSNDLDWQVFISAWNFLKRIRFEVINQLDVNLIISQFCLLLWLYHFPAITFGVFVISHDWTCLFLFKFCRTNLLVYMVHAKSFSYQLNITW